MKQARQADGGTNGNRKKVLLLHPMQPDASLLAPTILTKKSQEFLELFISNVKKFTLFLLF